MKKFKDLLEKLDACNAATEWAQEKTIETVVSEVHRGDWLLWLAKKTDLPIPLITLAKGKCAETVIHLMKDQRSKDAVKAAIDFGNGLISRDELNAAAAAAAAAADDADAAADAKKENQLKTANICREILGSAIIEKVNQLLNQ